jgi:aryl-alcohol dehydrogenase-like predicted oxidoreductase
MMTGHPLSRRDLLRLAGVALGSAILNPQCVLGFQDKMILRKIPRSGEALPAVGIGSYLTFDVSDTSDLEHVREVMRLFTDLGGRLVDSSPMYGLAESVIGDVTADLGINQELFFATKVWTSGRDSGIQQAQQSMSRMRTKKLDLLQVHNLLDVDTHLKWLHEWKQAGKIRYVGVTHYDAGAFLALEKYVTSKQVDFVQLNYSMAEREAEDRMLPAAAASGTAVIVNRPFAQASLFDRVKGRPLPEWTSEFDASSWAQFFLKYILANPAVTCVIPATRSPKHLEDNMGAAMGKVPDEKARQRMLSLLNTF